MDCKDTAHQKWKKKYLDNQAARNQRRWFMPKLKFGQYCTIMNRIKCAKFKSFWNCQCGCFSQQNLHKNNIFGSRTHFGPPCLIIVTQIQVKLISSQTYLSKVLLQSIVTPLDFSLSSYSPLKISKKYWSGEFDNFSTPS